MERTIEKIKDYIIDVAEPEAILLFGSVARGNHNVYSDVDLVVVSERSFSKKEITARLKSFIRELGLASDIHIHTLREIEKASEDPYSFLNLVVKNAKIIYKKQGLKFGTG